MALPPEQINIKRRREEEPVETLYIQSALHQTKRRFTDFVFQRVTVRSDGTPVNDDTVPLQPTPQRVLRTPRSVSSLHIPNPRAAAAQTISASGVPRVRATSPGAEIREAQRVAAARKDADEKRQRALHGPLTPQPASPSFTPVGDIPEAGKTVSDSASVASAASSQSRVHTVRRFQISRSSAPSPLSSLRSGIQKRRPDGAAPGVAVLVEQLQRRPHSRQASLIDDLVAQAESNSRPSSSLGNSVQLEPQPKPRKRPVVNQAEKKWREERQGTISAAKQHLSDTLEKSAQTHQSTWDQESERLAEEFERIAFEIERDMERDEVQDERFAPPTSRPQIPIRSPQPLKYQPRPPKQPRAVQSQQPVTAVPAQDTMNVAEDDDDYVYDVYIRRPLGESDMLSNPLAEAESDQLKRMQASTSGIGVIVITAEDEEYWEHFVEDDEEEWDSEDADSNAENNPANDYPEEELSASDEEDDPTAIYRKYRYRAASDDEEFDFDASGSESGAPYGSKFTQWRHGGNDYSDSESD
ncbi:hypothetical protein N7493_006929 [Penicillium malachiteum]|uniref:Transcription factor Iwr1 domain-containing protein n=1 Tax=Penicillium malachiteum TaxID=1324776 RepID=A0AAD6HJM2_9EURO|nr:hypothetical protein N7493_006929 [Penicillium malachiteum]